MTMTRRALAASALALFLAAAPLNAALAEPLTVQMTGQHRGVVVGERYAIPTYHVNFITSQQATSVVSIGARTRLAMVLEGVDEATLRRLADEAYADLRTQMEAAGLSLMSIEETRAMTQAAGFEEIPGNIEVSGIGPGITIGSSVRKGWVTVGPQAAPALNAFRTLRSTMGISGQIGAITAIQPFNRRPETVNGVVLAPSLTIDFARMEAARGGMFGGAARAGGNVALGVLSTSPVMAYRTTRIGLGTPGSFAPRADVFSNTPFAQVIEGGAAVRSGPSFSTTVDANYQAVQRARGDAVIVDLPVWEGLVRDAYRGYNAGIVQAITSVRR